jgi:HK97 family phage portal protein
MGWRDVLTSIGLVSRDDVTARATARAGPMATRAVGNTLAPLPNARAVYPDDTNVMVLTRDGYRRCVTAFAAINLIADSVAEATLRVYEDQGSGKREEVPNHPLRQLMQRPNPDKSESELLGLMLRHAAIAGFSVLEKVRSSRGNVVQLWPLNPANLKAIRRDQAPPDWEYTVHRHPLSPFRLSADDVVVFTYMDDLSLAPTGDTPLRAVMRQAGVLNALTDFVKLLLDRGGVPPIVLVADPVDKDRRYDDGDLTDADIEAIREQWMQRYGGYTNWTGPAVIQGVRIERVGLNLNELAFADLRDVIDLDVCRAFRVPPILVQVQAGIESSYGLMFEQSMRAMQLYTAGPLRARLDGALTRQLLPEFDAAPSRSREFDTSAVPALQEDADAKHTRARSDFAAGGITLDEYRQSIGQEAIGGDLGTSIMLPFSAMPTPIGGGLPADLGTTDDEARQFVRVVIDRAMSEEQQAREWRAGIGQSNKQTIGRIARRYAPLLHTFWISQGNRIIDAATRSENEYINVRAVDDIDWDAEERLMADLIGKLHNAGGSASWRAVEQQLGVVGLDWDLANPNVRQVLRDLATRIVGINETTRQDVRRVVAEAVDEGVTPQGLADKLRGLFQETYLNRSITVARTESMRAFNLGSTAGYQQTGKVNEVQLLDNAEHGDYDGDGDGLTCAQRDGMIVPLDEVSRHVDGTHPNCQLAVAPILATPLGAE